MKGDKFKLHESRERARNKGEIHRPFVNGWRSREREAKAGPNQAYRVIHPFASLIEAK